MALNSVQQAMDLLQDSARIIDPVIDFFFFLQKPIDISVLQRNLLTDHEVILDFWIHHDKIYAFIIDRDTIKLTQWEVPLERMREQLDSVILPFYQKRDLFQLEFDYHKAHQLYRYLFQPLEKYTHSFKTIIIIPDGFLTGFPFELLVVDTTAIGNYKKDVLYSQYGKLVYLINRYAMSYNYAASGYLLMSYRDRSVKKLGHRLLAMSEPIISNQVNDTFDQMGGLSFHNLEISYYSCDEIRRVSRLLWRHDILKKERATRKYLLEHGGSYRWLYLALPGLLNNLAPLNSGLLFTPEENDATISSSWLSVAEIMHCQLAADMLTLSNCQLVPANRNENWGVKALPQSFIFSGVQSVLFSLWTINSISTSQFMSKLYWEIKYKRQTNAKALQEAKVASMKDTFHFSGQEISRAHPYFWATFLLTGNPKIRPPSSPWIPYWGIIIIVYVIVIMVSIYITRKTMPGRR